MKFDSLESLGNVIERKLGIGELSNRSIEKMYYQYDIDTDNINVWGRLMNFELQLVPMTQVCLYFFLLNSVFLEAVTQRCCCGRAFWR